MSPSLLCSLVSGFLLAFAIVAMPGIRTLNDRDFIRAFQAIDGVIQNRQLIFMLVWGGSVAALLVSLTLGLGTLDESNRILILGAAATYLLGVQLPTFAINVPLNDKLQSVNIDSMDTTQQSSIRCDFEPRWNRRNDIRTIFAILTSVQLILLLYRI